ncbi:MAG: penicillin-binding protein activator [Pseudomonadota bacterium]
MLIKILNGLLAAAALVSLGACSTPCDAPGRLCAPLPANTSSAGAHARAADLAAPRPVTAPAPAASVQTMAVESPNAAPAAVPPGVVPVRIALLLPLRSEGLGPPADALRAGFMAAHERESAGFVVNLVDSGDSPDEALDAYMAALKQNDIIVGPLARSAVTAVAGSGAVSRPTIALNHPEGRGADLVVPPNMLVIGLSIEDEARQVARWAAAEHPGASALIVSGTNPWQRRLASAFAAQWKQLGNSAQTAELIASNGYLNENGIITLKSRIETEQPVLIFAALDADQLRQVRSIVGTELPAYGTSSVNPGTTQASAQVDLDGLRLLDMPWEVQPDNAAVMVYPRWLGNKSSLDMDRLYALGIDAYRIARQVALKPNTPFKMDGVTGRLAVDFNPARSRFERIQPGAVYQGGAFKLVEPKR